MIDLHCHSIHSDGTISAIKLLEEAEKNRLEVFSITDHDSVRAYYTFNNPSNYYSGKLIVGCEFNAIFNNQRIELLGYLFNLKQVNDFLEYYYSMDNVNKRKQKELEYFKKLCYKNNIKLSNDIKINDSMVIDTIYDDIIKYPHNSWIIDEDSFNSKTIFFRRCVGDKNFILYKNYYDDLPSAEVIADLIHSSKGLVFLAHPFVYAMDNIFAFMDSLKKNQIIDGIECYHSNFNQNDSDKLKQYALDNNLFISGGSDYHGTKYPHIKLGRGINNNLNISKDIVSNWTL